MEICSNGDLSTTKRFFLLLDMFCWNINNWGGRKLFLDNRSVPCHRQEGGMVMVTDDDQIYQNNFIQTNICSDPRDDEHEPL